jgi:hypothetical protein
MNLTCVYCEKTVTRQDEIGSLSQSDPDICVCKECLVKRMAQMESAAKTALYGSAP